MAPKNLKIDKNMLQPTVLDDSFLMPLMDISVCADSGWRPLDSKRVEALEAAFLRGEYGMNILKKPAVLSADGTTKGLKETGTDGNAVLVDGKHCIAALQEISKRVKADESGDELMLSPNLMKVLEEGVLVSVLEFPDAHDDDAILAWCVAAHDSDANQFKQCSIADLVDVAERFRAKQPGGKWKDAQSALEQVYGHGRRMFVYRMILCAQSLHAEVTQALAKSSIPNSWINENKYFVGQGADAPKKLTKHGQISVVGHAQEDIDAGMAVSGKAFRDETCMAYRHAELWLHSKRKVSGAESASPNVRN